MTRLKLNIEALRKDVGMLMTLDRKTFKVLRHSSITIDEEGISTNAGTKNDIAIPHRDSLVISALAFNLLLFIADKWDSMDKDCREFIESNLEMITNYMEEK